MIQNPNPDAHGLGIPIDRDSLASNTNGNMQPSYDRKSRGGLYHGTSLSAWLDTSVCGLATLLLLLPRDLSARVCDINVPRSRIGGAVSPSEPWECWAMASTSEIPLPFRCREGNNSLTLARTFVIVVLSDHLSLVSLYLYLLKLFPQPDRRAVTSLVWQHGPAQPNLF
jgi:hypothetical protein